MKCEWCGDGHGPLDYGGGLRYCSTDCGDSAIRYAAEVMKALSNGEEPPTEAEFKERQERAVRWTPETMQARVDELREAAE